MIVIDGGRLRQLLVNMLSVTCKYSASDEIVLFVEPETQQHGGGSDQALLSFRIEAKGLYHQASSKCLCSVPAISGR